MVALGPAALALNWSHRLRRGKFWMLSNMCFWVYVCVCVYLDVCTDVQMLLSIICVPYDLWGVMYFTWENIVHKNTNPSFCNLNAPNILSYHDITLLLCKAQYFEEEKEEEKDGWSIDLMWLHHIFLIVQSLWQEPTYPSLLILFTYKPWYVSHLSRIILNTVLNGVSNKSSKITWVM